MLCYTIEAHQNKQLEVADRVHCSERCNLQVKQQVGSWAL